MKTRKSLRDTLIENQKAEKSWATMYGKPLRDDLEPVKEKRVRAPNKPSDIPKEHVEQVAFVKWFRMQHRGVRIFAIPNAAFRSYGLAAYLKAEGMTKGVPDLCIPAWNLWIEFKKTKGSDTSPEQYEWEAYLNSIGHHHFFAFGCDDAIRKVTDFVTSAEQAQKVIEG